MPSRAKPLPVCRYQIRPDRRNLDICCGMEGTRHTDSLRGGVYMVIAMAIIGVIDNYVGRIAETVSLWQFHAMRSTVSLPILLALPFMGFGALRMTRPGAVALRSVLIASSMMLYFAALAFMPIAHALAGLFTSPIFILLITALGLRRRLGPWRILAVALGFAGILCVLQPDPDTFKPWMLMPVAAGFLYALTGITTRELCAGESTLVLLIASWIALGLMGAAGLAVLEVIAVDPPPGRDGFLTRPWVADFAPVLPLLALQVVGSITGVFLLTRGYQIGETSYIAVFEYSVMIFGPAWAWVMFGQALGLVQIGGLVLIAAAGAIIAVRSR